MTEEERSCSLLVTPAPGPAHVAVSSRLLVILHYLCFFTSKEVGSVDDGSLAWYESNPLATGGAVAGIIMIIGLLIIICCVRRKKRKKAIQDTR